MVTPIIKGITTIIWGPSGVLGSPAGAIVETISLTPKNAEPIEIEDNNGFGAIEVEIPDGFNAKISCIYDNAKLWPVEGANCVLNVPFNGATANTAIPFGASNVGQSPVANGVVSYTCLVASVEPAFARKKETMIGLNLTYRPNIAV